LPASGTCQYQLQAAFILPSTPLQPTNNATPQRAKDWRDGKGKGRTYQNEWNQLRDTEESAARQQAEEENKRWQ